jgi:hypothetical protein
MSEPSAPRPVPGPGRPVPGPAAPPADRPADDAVRGRFAELDGRPVAEHVEVFEAEHDRLQSELGTIDRV